MPRLPHAVQQLWYEYEAEGFADLAMSNEAKAFIHLFHGQNHCKKNKYGKPDVAVKKIGVQQKIKYLVSGFK